MTDDAQSNLFIAVARGVIAKPALICRHGDFVQVASARLPTRQGPRVTLISNPVIATASPSVS